MLRKTYRARLNLFYLLPVLFLSGLLPRLYFLQVVRKDHYAKRAKIQHNKPVTIVPCRGKILDRNGRELAGSTLMESVYVAPAKVPSELASDLAHDLAQALSLDYDLIYKRVTGKKNLPIARKITDQQLTEVRTVLIKEKYAKISDAIYFVQEGKRFYPRDDLAAHIIGYTEPDDLGDNKGLAGIERTYDAELRGKFEKVQSRTNAARHTLDPIEEEVLSSTFGHNVRLTIDESIQHAAEVALKRRVREVSADNGVAVVYGVKTGELLAIANCPSYSLNSLATANAEQRRNRALSDASEPGSVMKIISFAAAMEEKKVSMDDTFNCEGGAWTMPVTGRLIKDSHRMGVATVRDIFKYSSNIGIIKAAARLNHATFNSYLKKFGFGEKTGLDLTGESRGVLRPLKDWDGYTMSSIPVGYEIQLTAIQVVAAVGAVANRGLYMQPHIVKEITDYRGDVVKSIEPQVKRRVISASTARKIVDMMELVVLEGTGKTGQLSYHRSGGKTGTAKKLDEHKKYTDEYISSFCGIAPIEDPEIVVYVRIDNPRTESYGGPVSGPVFKSIADSALKILKVPVSKGEQGSPSLDVALEKIRNDSKFQFVDNRSPLPAQDDTVSPGSMPNLHGLTMREVRDVLDSLNVPFDFTGSGVALEQIPRPYETIESGQMATIKFGPESKLLAELATPDMRRVNDAVTTVADSPALVIERGNKSATLPIVAIPSVPVRSEHAHPVANPAKEMVVDADEYAQRKPDPRAAKDVWRQWEKEQKEQERLSSEDDEAAIVMPVARGVKSMRAPSESGKGTTSRRTRTDSLYNLN